MTVLVFENTQENTLYHGWEEQHFLIPDEAFRECRFIYVAVQAARVFPAQLGQMVSGRILKRLQTLTV